MRVAGSSCKTPADVAIATCLAGASLGVQSHAATKKGGDACLCAAARHEMDVAAVVGADPPRCNVGLCYWPFCIVPPDPLFMSLPVPERVPLFIPLLMPLFERFIDGLLGLAPVPVPMPPPVPVTPGEP